MWHSDVADLSATFALLPWARRQESYIGSFFDECASSFSAEKKAKRHLFRVLRQRGCVPAESCSYSLGLSPGQHQK
jgi:hypothetical protein